MKRPQTHQDPSPDSEHVLVITNMGGEGEGATAVDPLGRRVYTPLTLPGETIRAQVSGDRGRLVEIMSRSPDRTSPVCPHFGACGGCALQHWRSEPYLAWKVDRLRQTLARERIETEFLEPFAARPGSRRRITLHARRGSRPDVARLGFKRRGSWEVVDITECSIAAPALIAALPGLQRLAVAFLEAPKSAPSLHITLTATGLDIDVTGVQGRDLGLSADARRRAAEAAALYDFARVSLAGEILYQSRPPVVNFGDGRIVLPCGGFLQASAEAERVMTQDAVEAARGAKRIADLFCGAGAFTFPLASVAPVLAVDSAAPSIDALRKGLATAPGLKSVEAVARDLFRRPLSDKELKTVDVVVMDPPRAGALEQTLAVASSGAQTVVAVSCNPATFVRDAAALIQGGFRLSRLRPVDQFLWSAHIEVIGVFER